MQLKKLDLHDIWFLLDPNMLAHTIAQRSLVDASVGDVEYFDCIPCFISCIARSDVELN